MKPDFRMPIFDLRELGARGLVLISLLAPGALHARERGFLLDRGPLTLNPRRSSDAAGQRIGALLFAALTRLDENLEVQPDLAADWKSSEGGRVWKFRLRAGAVDHAGQPIDAARMAACLERYRAGKPVSVQKAAFPGWLSTTAAGPEVTLRFERPSPYLPRNLSALRYFVADGEPCAEPTPASRVVTSGPYRLERWDPHPERTLRLLPAASPRADEEGRDAIRFDFVGDDNSRLLRYVRGDAELTQNGLPLTKTRYVERRLGDRYRLVERDGINVSYLAFNLRDPLLAKREVRQALAEAIDRRLIVERKFMGFCTVAGSLLSPMLPESHPLDFRFDPAHAEALLDQAGYPRQKDPKTGVRFELHYRTTPNREGVETALLFQSQLERIGVRIVIDSVEQAVFLPAIREGRFQLFSSRWIGASDGSLFYRILRSGEPDNRVGYRDPEVDAWLDRASAEVGLPERRALLAKVQAKIAVDLPYFPLWYWNNALIARRGDPALDAIRPADLSLSGALEPLFRKLHSR